MTSDITDSEPKSTESAARNNPISNTSKRTPVTSNSPVLDNRSSGEILPGSYDISPSTSSHNISKQFIRPDKWSNNSVSIFGAEFPHRNTHRALRLPLGSDPSSKTGYPRLAAKHLFRVINSTQSPPGVTPDDKMARQPPLHHSDQYLV